MNVSLFFFISPSPLVSPLPSFPDRTRPDLLSEDQQRRFAQEIQSLQVTEVLRQLEDFR